MKSVNKYRVLTICVIFLIITQISQASVLYSRYLPFTIGLIIVFIDLINTKRGYNKFFVIFVISWIAINMVAVILNDVPFFIPRLVINTINILFLPYLLIRRMKMEFWIKFEQIVFFLTALSLPLYFLSLIFNSFFNNLESFFSPLTNPVFLGGEHYYWSSIFYTHINVSSVDRLYHFKRNCGFMWEPGSFSMILVWAIMFNWLFYDRKPFDKRIIIYLVALATTFSTGGYIAFSFLMAGRFIKRITFVNAVVLICAMTLFYFTIFRFEFVSGKVNQYIEVFDEDPSGEAGYTGRKVNRLQGGIAAFNRTLKFPIGYGLVSEFDRGDEDYAYGTNGLASLLEMWGFFLFPMILIYIYRSLKIFGKRFTNKTMFLFYFFALLIVFFSNPIARNLFVYFLVATSLAINAAQKTKLSEVKSQRNEAIQIP